VSRKCEPEIAKSDLGVGRIKDRAFWNATRRPERTVKSSSPGQRALGSGCAATKYPTVTGSGAFSATCIPGLRFRKFML